MFELVVSETCLRVDTTTQIFDPTRICAYIWHPCSAVQSFEEGCQLLNEELLMIAGLRGCEMALVSGLDFTDLRHQRFEGHRSSVELLPFEEGKRVRVTLKVSQIARCPGRGPFNANIDQTWLYVFEVFEQK
jgi:hypothetical protein